MRSIGLPEIVLVLGTLFSVAVYAIAAGIVVWIIFKRRQKAWMIPVRSCPGCGQQIPSIGSFCSFCGQRIA